MEKPLFFLWVKLPISAFLGAICFLLCITGCAPTKKETSPPPRGVKKETVAYQIPPTLPNEALLENALEALEIQPENAHQLLKAGILYQRLSPPDRWHYADKAIDYLTQASDALPQHPELWLYLGLSKAGKARDPETSLLKKLALARAGFAHMDEGVAMATNNLSLRLLRAKASLMAPGILGRESALKQDHHWISAQVKKTDEVPLHLIAMSYIFLGDYAHRVSKDSELTQTYYRAAMVAGRGTPWEEKANHRLLGKPSNF